MTLSFRQRRSIQRTHPSGHGQPTSRLERRTSTDASSHVARVARVKTGLTIMDLWRRGQHGWPAGVPVVQFPNGPLLVAFGGWLVAVLTDGSVHAYARATFYTGLAAWAWSELADGTNWFRRALGAGVLVYVVMKVGVALGA